ncbi:hypothetical protein ASPWEDRAFT_102920 [Aspergillus wentii DTO 134E9]|uniref:FAD dependent oxidoreductase domain-containing protein n=1 Tax=Aspergillus wentii DTO 134E9 TaxID=1073089 RepID=A0A1L9S2R4_ASPWE|nr:uncharacterized protein ASPWEDRAFT_102920 [Aspergillus wentii DTO 134E9]KAI9924487.1 hypothetical protein MW887_007114 [Aspergillus wentii]OJJ41448.1 hypothetical protein ASPWEDRAFT_102920 [Aspergillus wentii DTO 134E9]
MGSAGPLPAFFPVDNSTSPCWRTELHQLDKLRTTPELPEQSDIVIIGAGYSGVSIAYHLLKLQVHQEKPPSITILEARQICSGATGRNGGHLRPDVYGHIPKYIERYGVEAGAELANFEISHVKAFKDLLAEEEIDCDFTVTRNMNVYLNDAAAEKAKKTYEALATQKLSFVDDLYFTPEKNAEGISGVKGAKACLSYTAGTLWPYKFIMGLLSKIIKSDTVNVQANTPVTEVTADPNGSSHIVNTPRGSIRASKVVHATNAYTLGLLPEYSANIIPCRGICCHIAVPEGKNTPYLPYSYCLGTENGDGGSYLISRPDGSIVVGGAQYTFKSAKDQWFNVVDDSTLIEPTKNYYNDYMQRTFKGWEDTGAYVKEIWTGIMGYSYDSNPHVSDIPGKPGQYICAGFNGHGMPVILLAAKALAEMISTGKSFEEVQMPRLFKSTTARLEKAQKGPEGGDILA